VEGGRKLYRKIFWLHVAALSLIIAMLVLPYQWKPLRAEGQSHRYYVLDTSLTDSAGSLLEVVWLKGDWMYGSGCPFATRAPYLTPTAMWLNITFGDRDLVTGIVNLKVPRDSYKGLNHVFFSADFNLYFKVETVWTSSDNGVGWLFTGQGINPILGDVDIFTFSNKTGTYFLGPDRLPGTSDDVFISSATVPPDLTVLTGHDGIPGTGDDNFGDGTQDSAGSSVLYLPVTLRVSFWDGSSWVLLFESPWPQIFVTGSARNSVVEPNSLINGTANSEKGAPWGFVNIGWPWGDPKSNAFVRYVCAYSVLNVSTVMGPLDVHYIVDEYLVKEDYVQKLLADIDGNLKVEIKDVAIVSKAFGGVDEGFGNPVASPNFSARADVNADSKNDIKDVARVSRDFGKIFTPEDP